MQLLLVVVLGAFACSHIGIDAHAIAYPHRSELLSYAPARGQFPVQNGIAHGFIRYLDSDGTPRLVGYRYPEPLYGVRSVSGESAPQSLQKASFASAISHTEELEKAQLREQHFREWCQQRYAALKSETERLEAEGKQPSQDMLAQLKPLETLLSADGVYSETPELQQAREEHFRIWNEARLKVLQQQEEHLKLHGAQRDAQQSASQLNVQSPVEVPVAVSETAEQQKAREEHLRIYQEHLQRIQQLQQQSAPRDLEAVQPQNNEAIVIKAATDEHKIIAHLNQLQETPEVLRAKQEHLRLWSEAKLLAEQAEKHMQQQQQHQLEESANVDVDSKATVYSASRIGLESEAAAAAAPNVPAPVQDTAEVQRAREQHLRIVEETQQLLQLAAQQQQAIAPALKQPAAAQTQLLAQQQQQESSQLKTTSHVDAQPEAPQDTPEVQRARAAHLQLVNEANLKATQYHSAESEMLSTAPQPLVYVANENENVDALKEAEFLRVEEAKLREAERLLELTRLKEEERMQIAERVQLQEEEQRRQMQERIEDAKQREQDARFADKTAHLTQEQKTAQQQQTQVKTQVLITLPSATRDLRDEEQYSNNPFLLRLAVPAGGVNGGNAVASTGASFIGEQQQQQNQLQYASPGYYFVRDADSGLVKLDNPFFIRHLEQGMKQAAQPAEQSDSVLVSAVDATAAVAGAEAAPQQTVRSDVGISGKYLQSITPAPAVAEALKVDPGANAGLAAWQKATREHFRAYEMALEQLRLSSLNNPAKKDNCN